jgi:hypothetical protein
LSINSFLYVAIWICHKRIKILSVKVIIKHINADIFHGNTNKISYTLTDEFWFILTIQLEFSLSNGPGNTSSLGYLNRINKLENVFLFWIIDLWFKEQKLKTSSLHSKIAELQSEVGNPLWRIMGLSLWLMFMYIHLKYWK